MAQKFSKYLKTCFALGSLSLGLYSVINSAQALTPSVNDNTSVYTQNSVYNSTTNRLTTSNTDVRITPLVSYDLDTNSVTTNFTTTHEKMGSFILADYQAVDKTNKSNTKATTKDSKNAKDPKAKPKDAKDTSDDKKSDDKNTNNTTTVKNVADDKSDNKADDKANADNHDKDTAGTGAANDTEDQADDKNAKPDTPPANYDQNSIKDIQKNIDDWQQEIDQLNSSKDKTLAQTTRLANLQQAINFAKQALTTYQTIDQYQASLDDLQNQVEQAKADLIEEQKQLDNFHNTASNDKQLKQQSIDLNKSVEDIKAKIAALKPAENSINTLILDNGKLLADVNKQLSAPDLEESTKFKLVAERAAITARNDLLKKKQSSTNLITTTNQQLTDLYNQQIVLVEKQLEAVNQAYKQQELAQKQAEINKNPILAAESIINESLKSQLEVLTKKQTDLQKTLDLRQDQLDDAKRVSSTIDSQIKLLQGTLELNRLINDQKTLLPNISNAVDYSKKIIDWRVISFQLQAQLQKIKSEKDYVDNISPASLINSLQTLAPGSNSVSTILQIQEQASNVSEETKGKLVPILTARKEMLAKIIGIYTNIIDVTTKIDTAQESINAIIKSINDKLNQQDFFVRSTPPVTSSWIKSYAYSAKVQLSGLTEKFTLKVGNIEIYIFGIVLLALGWIVSRQKRWINFNLEKLRNRINIRNKDNILVTPFAILLTFIRTLDRPLIWGGATLIITNSIFVDQNYIYDYFNLVIEFILIYNFTLALVIRGGIVNCHYSPEGSFYAKTANNDADLLNETTIVPQPQVKAFPTKIFASSKTVQLIDFTFIAERKAYLKRVELNSGIEPVDEDHTLYVSPKEKQFEKARKERLENEAKLKAKREEEERKAKEKALAEELARLEAEEQEKAKEEANLAAQELAKAQAEDEAKSQTIAVDGTTVDTTTDATELNNTEVTIDANASTISSDTNETIIQNITVTNSTNNISVTSENATVDETNANATTVVATNVTANTSATTEADTTIELNTTNPSVDTTSYAKVTVDPTLVTAQSQLQPKVDTTITPDGLRNDTHIISEPNISQVRSGLNNVSVTATILPTANTTVSTANASATNPQYNNSNSSDLVSDDDGYSQIPPNYVPPVAKITQTPTIKTVKINSNIPKKPQEEKPTYNYDQNQTYTSPQSKAQIDYERQREHLDTVLSKQAKNPNAPKPPVKEIKNPTKGELDETDQSLLDEINKDLAKTYTPFPIYSVDQSSDGFITDNEEFAKACELSKTFVHTSQENEHSNNSSHSDTNSAKQSASNVTAKYTPKNLHKAVKAKKRRYYNDKVCLSTDLSEEIQEKATRDLRAQLSPNSDQDAQAQVYDYQNIKRRSNSGRVGVKFSSAKFDNAESDSNKSDTPVRVRNEVPQPMLYNGIDETLVTQMPGTPEYIREKYNHNNSEQVPSASNPDIDRQPNDPNANLILGTHLDKDGNIRDIHGNILLTKEQVKVQQQDGGNIDINMNYVQNNNNKQATDKATEPKISDEEKDRKEKIWSSTPKDKYHYTEDGDKTDQVDKILEADKYFNLSDAPVHDQFKRNAEISDDLQYLFTHIKWILFFLINIIFFNIHPGVSPSENIFGQTLYLISMVILIVTVLAFARAYLKRRARRLEEINTKIKLFWWIITMIPIIFFILVFEGYVNTTNILLGHAFYSFYALVIAFIFWRSIQRTFAIFSINIAAKSNKHDVNSTQNGKNDSYDHHITNIYEEQRRALQDHHNAQRTSYFDNFVGLNKLANVISAIVLITVLLFVWSDLISIIGYLNNITVWKVEGTTPGTTSDITLFSIFNSLLTIFITVIIYKNLKPLLDVLLFSRIKMAEGLPYAIETVLSYLVIALGFASSFSSLGLSWSKLQWLFSALLVGLGFGLQEIFANFVSGIIILFERPIRINDFVTINDVTGSIQNIRIRATTIIDPDNKEVIIPNKTFVTGQFINWSLSDTRTRLVYNIGVAYGSDIDLVTMTLLEAAEMCPLVIHEPNPPSCYFMEFGASSLNFVLRVHVKMLADRLITIHEINRNINNLCNERGINITFNQLDVFIKNGSGIDVKIDSSDLRTTNDTAKAAQSYSEKAAPITSTKGNPNPKANNAKNKSDEYFDMVA